MPAKVSFTASGAAARPRGRVAQDPAVKSQVPVAVQMNRRARFRQARRLAVRGEDFEELGGIVLLDRHAFQF